MRRLSVVIAALAAATFVAAVGSGLDHPSVQHGGEATAMVALAACVVLAGRDAPRLLRATLVAFCLFLAAAALIKLAADRVPFAPMVDGPNGCPGDSTANTDYWRGQLRYGQVAEVVRFLALACATMAVRLRPGSSRPLSPRIRVIATVILILAVLLSLSPLTDAFDTRSALGAAVPAYPVMAMAAALVVATWNRVGGRSMRNAVLVIGAALTALRALTSVDTLAGLSDQLPGPPSAGAVCLDFTTTVPGPSVPAAIGPIVVSALFFLAPAMIAWSIRPRLSGFET